MDWCCLNKGLCESLTASQWEAQLSRPEARAAWVLMCFSSPTVWPWKLWYLCVHFLPGQPEEDEQLLHMPEWEVQVHNKCSHAQTQPVIPSVYFTAFPTFSWHLKARESWNFKNGWGCINDLQELTSPSTAGNICRTSALQICSFLDWTAERLKDIGYILDRLLMGSHPRLP